MPPPKILSAPLDILRDSAIFIHNLYNLFALVVVNLF